MYVNVTCMNRCEIQICVIIPDKKGPLLFCERPAGHRERRELASWSSDAGAAAPTSDLRRRSAVKRAT